MRPLTEEEMLEGSSLIGHKIAEDNMIVLMDPSEDPDDILRANRSRERQFIFDMVFDAKATQVSETLIVYTINRVESSELIVCVVLFNSKTCTKRQLSVC